MFSAFHAGVEVVAERTPYAAQRRAAHWLDEHPDVESLSITCDDPKVPGEWVVRQSTKAEWISSY
jgi:hypothetical protein